MRTKNVFLTVALVVASLLNVGLTCAQDKTTIKFGFVADISGIGYVFSQSQIAGLQIAINDINASGGILGKQVELVMRDAQLKADVGANISRQLILQHQVEFLLLPTT